jgi:hypothetical protein
MPSDGLWRNPNWKITRFDLPKSGSYTEIAEYKKAHGLEATKKEYAYCLLSESPFAPNGLTNIGIGILWNLVIETGAPYVGFAHGHARLGVSDNTTAFNAENDTNLLATGGSNMFMQVIDVSFPVISSPIPNQTSWEATFDGSTANFGWQSFGVDNDEDDGAGTVITQYDGVHIGLLNRYVTNQGTKPSGQTWILTLIIQQS